MSAVSFKTADADTTSNVRRVNLPQAKCHSLFLPIQKYIPVANRPCKWLVLVKVGASPLPLPLQSSMALHGLSPFFSIGTIQPP